MAQMLPPAGLQGEDRLEMALLGSPQSGPRQGHCLKPRYRWLEKRLELGLGFALELVLRRPQLDALQTVPLKTVGLTDELLEVEPARGLLPVQYQVAEYQVAEYRVVERPLVELLNQGQRRWVKPLGFALGVRLGFGLQQLPQEFEPALALKLQPRHLVRSPIHLLELAEQKFCQRRQRDAQQKVHQASAVFEPE